MLAQVHIRRYEILICFLMFDFFHSNLCLTILRVSNQKLILLYCLTVFHCMAEPHTFLHSPVNGQLFCSVLPLLVFAVASSYEYCCYQYWREEAFKHKSPFRFHGCLSTDISSSLHWTSLAAPYSWPIQQGRHPGEHWKRSSGTTAIEMDHQ